MKPRLIAETIIYRKADIDPGKVHVFRGEPGKRYRLDYPAFENHDARWVYSNPATFGVMIEFFPGQEEIELIVTELPEK